MTWGEIVSSFLCLFFHVGLMLITLLALSGSGGSSVVKGPAVYGGGVCKCILVHRARAPVEGLPSPVSTQKTQPWVLWRQECISRLKMLPPFLPSLRRFCKTHVSSTQCQFSLSHPMVPRRRREMKRCLVSPRAGCLHSPSGKTYPPLPAHNTWPGFCPAYT